MNISAHLTPGESIPQTQNTKHVQCIQSGLMLKLLMPITSLRMLRCHHAGHPQPLGGSTWAGASLSLLLSSMHFLSSFSAHTLHWAELGQPPHGRPLVMSRLKGGTSSQSTQLTGVLVQEPLSPCSKISSAASAATHALSYVTLPLQGFTLAPAAGVAGPVQGQAWAQHWPYLCPIPSTDVTLWPGK